jgi:3-methyladenine DNA glycosylase/8-oxoguanine DNA glycosylase
VPEIHIKLLDSAEMPVRAELRPKGPYSLRLSGRLASDATRTVSGGTYRATFRVDDRLERVSAAQRADGAIAVAAESDAGVDHVRFVLGLDDDHSEFVRRFANDPMLSETLRQVRGLRPIRTATVAQALLRAVTGQLIRAREARRIERRIIQRTSPERDGLHAAPTAEELARFSPPELGRLGLGARRAAALIRICRTLDLEGLKGKPSAAVALRLNRERGLGPWSVGVVCLEGLGRYEYGLARDLGLIKLASALAGRWVEAEESDALLAPYGEWAGLASVYLLAGFGRGLLPLPRAAAA